MQKGHIIVYTLVYIIYNIVMLINETQITSIY